METQTGVLKKQTSEDGGQLEVGTDGAGRVVIKHCNAAFVVDDDARGWITFWPPQARTLACLLLRHAREAEGEQVPEIVPAVTRVAQAAWALTIEEAIDLLEECWPNVKHMVIAVTFRDGKIEYEVEAGMLTWGETLAEAVEKNTPEELAREDLARLHQTKNETK